MVEDPVCGMTVDKSTSLFSDFEGQHYYFCSEDCKQEFDDDPERYVGWGGTALSGVRLSSATGRIRKGGFYDKGSGLRDESRREQS